MRKIFNRILSLLLTIATILSILITPSFADYNGDGTKWSPGATDSRLSWDTDYQGYRITIVDKDGNLVADPVDFLFSQDPINAEHFFTCKLEEFNSRTTRNRVVYIDQMLAETDPETGKRLFTEGDMPKPMIWVDDGPMGQGTVLRTWMLGDLENFTNTEWKPSYNGNFTPIGQTIKVDPSTPTAGNEQPEEKPVASIGKGKEWIKLPDKKDDMLITYDEYLKNKTIEELGNAYKSSVIDKAFSK